MIAVSHKAKQYLLAAAKVLVLAVTFGYIFYKLKNNSSVNMEEFLAAIFSRGSVSGIFFLFFLGLAAANWVFEILKWQTLISTFEKISFKTAAKQSLASLTISMATPNRIGEYGAKALFFTPKMRKKILLLNLFSNGAQLFATVLFGAFGLVYILRNFSINYTFSTIVFFGIGIAVIITLAYYFKEKDLVLKGYSLGKIIRFFKRIPFHNKFKAVLFSIIRYSIFSGMFYGLLLFFGAQIAMGEAFPIIFAMYLLSSILPSIFILDVVIRGGVAVWLFSFVEIAELPVLSTVLAMWILNFVIPSILGSFFVLTYQPSTQ